MNPHLSLILRRQLVLLLALMLLVPVLASAQPAIKPATEIGLLWRLISPQGKVSHLYGTMHSANPKITTLAPPVQAAFDRSKRVVLELKMAPGSMDRSGAMLMYSAGRELSDDVPEPLLSEVRALGGRKGLSFMVLSRMKPWAVAVTLTSPPSKQGEFLDLALAKRARKAGKTVIGLETAEEQLQTFNDLSVADQLTLLQDVVDEIDELPALFRDLESAYLARDLGRILELSEQDLAKPGSGLAERLLVGLIDGRNMRMAERMQSALQAGESFVAVGALHLPGGNGLLQLLKERGYRVSVVY